MNIPNNTNPSTRAKLIAAFTKIFAGFIASTFDGLLSRGIICKVMIITHVEENAECRFPGLHVAHVSNYGGSGV
jgi:hypothetical protein